MQDRHRMTRDELRAEYRARVFQVFNGDEWMCSFGDMFFMQPDAANPTRNYSLDDVLHALTDGFDDTGGTDSRDLAVWRNGRILAVIRNSPDGRLEVTRF